MIEARFFPQAFFPPLGLAAMTKYTLLKVRTNFWKAKPGLPNLSCAMLRYFRKVAQCKSTILTQKRMHSSRMRTGRSLTGGGGVCVWSGGGLLLGRGVPDPGGGGGACLVRGGIPACTEADTPPPCGQTHACKNITLAQLRCGR